MDKQNSRERILAVTIEMLLEKTAIKFEPETLLKMLM